MRLVCPTCGACHSLEAWVAEPVIRETLGVLVKLPIQAVWYIGLFRPKGIRGLIWPKALRLAKELYQLVAAGHASWKQEPARPCTLAIWSEAIDRVLANTTLTLPLDDHNYLRKIAYNLADKADREKEVHRNEIERTTRILDERQAVQGPVQVKTGPERLGVEIGKIVEEGDGQGCNEQDIRAITDQYRHRRKG